MGKYVLDSEWGTKYKNFRKSEFKCKCGKCNGYGNGIASSLVENLQKLRDKYGAINITSGYRCPAKNKSVGGSSSSKHMQGLAADFYFQSGITSNQSKRVAIVNEIKKMPNYRYSYCNVNGSYPNMGSAIHADFKLVDTSASKTKYVQLTSNVWCRKGGYGFKYPKYKVIPKGTKVELLKKNVGYSDGYKWDKVKYDKITVYLPNKWSKYL